MCETRAHGGHACRQERVLIDMLVVEHASFRVARNMPSFVWDKGIDQGGARLMPLNDMNARGEMYRPLNMR